MSFNGRFTIARLVFIAAVILEIASGQLTCYQGQQNASMPVQGSPMACPMMSMSCIKSVDPSMNLASRACQTTNCTLNGMVSATGVCQNATTYPFQTYCCCYGNGCNGAWSQLSGNGFGLFAALAMTLIPLGIGGALMKS
jgi:hypothetical protein